MEDLDLKEYRDFVHEILGDYGDLSEHEIDLLTRRYADYVEGDLGKEGLLDEDILRNLYSTYRIEKSQNAEEYEKRVKYGYEDDDSFGAGSGPKF